MDAFESTVMMMLDKNNRTSAAARVSFDVSLFGLLLSVLELPRRTRQEQQLFLYSSTTKSTRSMQSRVNQPVWLD
jgi:hypothetical protein